MLRILCPLVVLVSAGCTTANHSATYAAPERIGFYSPFEPASDSFVRCRQKQFACTPANVHRDQVMEARKAAQARANHRPDDW